MLKKVIPLVLSILLLASLTLYADESQIMVLIDGEPMIFTQDYGFPIEQNDRILLPFRQIFEQYGWTPAYEPETETIFAIKGTDYMAMQIGSKAYHFGPKTVDFDTAPTIINDRTMVPVRVISEGLGFGVNYDEANRTVIISTK